MNFNDFLGNEKIKEQLSVLIETKRLPHAIILEGEEGMGKRTLARNIALNLFCRGEEKPCLECAQCKKVLKEIHPDLYEYTAPDRTAGFHVDKVREVIDDAGVKPNEADYKVYILGNAQSMNLNSQNALLKLLEEPPSYAVFILTVTNKSAMLETVLSRSVMFTLEGAPQNEAAEYICQKDENVTFDEAYKALEVWGGNIGKALETLNDGKLSKISDLANEMATNLIKDSEYELLKTCSNFVRDNETLLSTLVLLKAIFRDALFIEVDSISGQRETAKLLSNRLSRKKLLRLTEACDNICRMIKRNGNNAILVTKACYELRRAIGR